MAASKPTPDHSEWGSFSKSLGAPYDPYHCPRVHQLFSVFLLIYQFTFLLNLKTPMI